ncbi:AAA family ATPase [Rhodopseudomonas palustris]|uniref:AAA family ATPase n=1 Tax=Rhodopseudomonas palustris TaxID=1076 RepID=UPI002ACDEEAF|nr:AAA family ATPase [Rhodopseudomonas palustris]WQH00883.1 AAA family ATPase [Rhodopseudomonas palustris]
MNLRNLSRSRVVSRQRTTDVGVAVARHLLVRSLRQNRMHHVLAGCVSVVGFVLRNAADGETFEEAGRTLYRNPDRAKRVIRPEILHWDSEASVRQTRENDLGKTLAGNDHVIGFAYDEDAFPLAFRLAADGILPLAVADLSVLKAASRAAGIRGLADEVLATAVGEPLALLSMVIKPGRSRLHIERSLRRVKKDQLARSSQGRSSVVTMPSLDDLHGFGEAAVWGHELAKDLEDYRAGRLPWADVDRGVLISGPTGTGKTTFAQALARTCRVPIHIHSLARWQAAGYLNDLLKAMRRAFRDAIVDAPSILFIDELDSFGDRETLEGRHEQYSREVINAFLECLDGVDGREGVVVVGATNLPDKIDKAILRPGRLGKHVKIPLPDLDARIGILRHHLRGDCTSADLADIALRLEGASGAVIEQLVRDARRKARSERRPMTFADLLHGLPVRIVQTEEAFHEACVHEAGHALVGHFLGGQSGNRLIESQVFREVGMDGSGGRTVMRQIPGRNLGKAAYSAQIAILLAGIAAEEIVFGDHADGGGGTEDSDLRQATLIAATMEVSLGLGSSLVYLSSRRPDAVLARLQTDPLLRQHVATTLDGSFMRAKRIITDRATAFDRIVGLLLERGCASAEEIECEIATA